LTYSRWLRRMFVSKTTINSFSGKTQTDKSLHFTSTFPARQFFFFNKKTNILNQFEKGWENRALTINFYK
jgi:hypothetical protein